MSNYHFIFLIRLIQIFILIYIGLKNFKQAEDYLLLAKYALFKSKKQDYKIRYQLHRNLGILYSYKKQYNEALVELSNDVIQYFNNF